MITAEMGIKYNDAIKKQILAMMETKQVRKIDFLTLVEIYAVTVELVNEGDKEFINPEYSKLAKSKLTRSRRIYCPWRQLRSQWKHQPFSH